ncbi:MAG: hypothetical protein Alpg2KO_01110 [Alphaproteobacteria bacterium]
MHEDAMQVDVANWLHQLEREGLLIFKHTPNGKNRSAREGYRLKQMGTRAGWPDLDIILPAGTGGIGYARMIAIELKYKRGSLNPAQREMLPKLREAGIPVYEVKALNGDDAILKIKPILMAEGVSL